MLITFSIELSLFVCLSSFCHEPIISLKTRLSKCLQSLYHGTKGNFIVCSLNEWMNEWMIRKCTVSYSYDWAPHEFGEQLWIKGSDHCLNQCCRGWWDSLPSGSWVPLACLLLQVCARGDARVKRGVAFCLINLAFDMLLGEINERWTFTMQKRKNLFSVCLFLNRFLCPWNSPGKNTGMGCHSLLQGIFLTQASNPSLLHCRQILYHLSHQGSPN